MKKGWKKAISLTLACGMLAGALPVAARAASPFTDVSANAWYSNAVSYVYSNSLMGGVGGSCFAPEDVATRAQVVTILYRMEGQPAVSGNSSFQDVGDEYYKNAVIWAAKNGIVSGGDNGNFLPSSPVTREQMATFLYRYAAYKKFTVSQTANAVFSDQWQIEPYALVAMRWAVATGVLTGTENNTLDPKGETSRAQLATVLMRFGKFYNIVIDAPVPTTSAPVTVASSGTITTTNKAGESVQLPSYQFLWPIQGSLSSGFGYRYIFGATSFHCGIDIPAPLGTAVHAGQSGTVAFSGEKSTYGNLVILDHGNGYQTYYAHNSKLLLKQGDVVQQGDVIAAVGATGRATGNHCHFEVRYEGQVYPPLDFLPEKNNAPINTIVSMTKAELDRAIAMSQPIEQTEKPDDSSIVAMAQD